MAASKNTRATASVRLHGSYGVASHDARRKVPNAKMRWAPRTTAPAFDPKMVARDPRLAR